jgi:DNA-binding CsgD family transcriptional regulator
MLADLSGIGDPDGPNVGVLFGTAGVGKTELLASLAKEAGDRRAISLRGTPALQLVPFGILTRLIAAIESDGAVDLPAPQRTVLTLIAKQGPVDGALVRLAVATLLDLAGRDRPLLVLIDDLHDVDPGSRAVLIAVAGRVARGRLVLIFGVRGDSVPADIAPGSVAVALGPLTDAQAGELLDRQPNAPTGRRRFDVLRCAAGNPLAILELTRHRVELPDAVPGAGAVALNDVLAASYGADLSSLPERTRWAVLLAAAGEPRLQVLQAPPVDIAPEDWDAAEAVGVISVVGGLVRFRHPLVESAVYFAETENRRGRAHAVLAEALADEPGLVAWHRSACTTHPDEPIAQGLTDYAEQVVAVGDTVTAALVLQRAAELTPNERTRAQRLLRAAELAGSTGQVSWVAELVAPVASSPALADLHPHAAALLGWLEMMADRPGAAIDVLLPVAEANVSAAPDLVDVLLSTAALPVYAVGTAVAFDRMARALDRAAAAGADLTTPAMTWATVVARPSAEVAARVRAIVSATTISGMDGFLEAFNAGACCLLLDESRRCIEHLEPVRALLRRGVAFSPALTTFAALGWAYLDVARLTAAQANAAAATGASALSPAPVVTAVATVQTAIASLVLGRYDDAVAAACRTVESSEDPALGAQLEWALGRYAASRGDVATAWTHLRGLYDETGVPGHGPVGLLAIGDACSTAARLGRHEEAQRMLAATRATRDWYTRRQELILTRAEAVLRADGATVLGSIAEDPAAPEWPLEHGLSLLDLGMIRHKARQSSAARDALHAAASVFEQIGARQWGALARARLRAAGERLPPPPGVGLDALTEQQQRIVRLAAEGLSNQEIGERLFLSPRTVGSHLYRAFPKLGISSRAQLASVLDSAAQRDDS